MTPLGLLLALIVFIVVWVSWLAFVFIFPVKWSRFVDWEHAFFLERGLSKSISREIKRLETGIVLKVILSGTILLALMSLSLVVARYFLGMRI